MRSIGGIPLVLSIIALASGCIRVPIPSHDSLTEFASTDPSGMYVCKYVGTVFTCVGFQEFERLYHGK